MRPARGRISRGTRFGASAPTAGLAKARATPSRPAIANNAPRVVVSHQESKASKTAQNTSAQLGGLPVAGDSSVITDENTKTLQQNFDSVVKNDGLAFYPDWPVPGFYDQLVSFGQSIVNGSKSPTDALTALGQYYDSGRKDLTGK